MESSGIGQGTPAAYTQPNGGGSAPAEPTGQGGQQPQQGQQPNGDGFRQMFPQISDELWPSVEGNLKQVQGRMTQLEQIAKPLSDAGITDPQQLQGLANFGAHYMQDPAAALTNAVLGVGDQAVPLFLAIAEGLQQQGVIDEDLDLEELAAVATGQGEQYGPDPEGQGMEDVQPDDNGQVPRWAQTLIEQGEQLQNQWSEFQQNQQTQQQRIALNRAVAGVKEQLEQANVPIPEQEGMTPEQVITAAIIAAKGDTGKAVQYFTSVRDAVVAQFAQENGEQPGGSTMPRGAPPTRQQKQSRSGNAFDEANGAAMQYLKSQNTAAAQE